MYTLIIKTNDRTLVMDMESLTCFENHSLAGPSDLTCNTCTVRGIHNTMLPSIKHLKYIFFNIYIYIDI